MRRHRIFTLTGAAAALGLAGVVAGSTVTQASPQHTDRVLTLQPDRPPARRAACGPDGGEQVRLRQRGPL
jgi:hypothetical protein